MIYPFLAMVAVYALIIVVMFEIVPQGKQSVTWIWLLLVLMVTGAFFWGGLASWTY